MQEVRGFNHLTLNVGNLEKTISFYTEILQMTLCHRGRRDAYLEWGNAWICIVEEPDFASVPARVLGMNHIAFYIEESGFQSAVRLLRERGVTIVRGPLKRGAGWSVNFLDNNGIEFELHTSTLAERMSVWS
ncbi:hypothetical protein XYCOK13_24400 [Xylanibacillus composti]|uniref:VOC domain-containing protein n=1 Tax=Xylanibacillus composti TaxID=1572762 RepID=A0A8J4H510_9BACL|nr:VOC family protein [Xylanibacillus composti]GIQ69616.1 hypothetical protein XYCOK13_24400 [Xylanibacillus composti]